MKLTSPPAEQLCSIFFLSEPRSGGLQRQFFHTLGMSGFLVCTVISLKLLGPAADDDSNS